MRKKNKKKESKVGFFDISEIKNRNSEKISKIRMLAIDLCKSECFDFVHLEYLSEYSGKVLRLYIDKVSGVTLNDCVFISDQFSDILDVEFDNFDSYRLEVSSPGLKKSLMKLSDFDCFIGKMVKIELKKNKQNIFFWGKIMGIDSLNNMVSLLVYNDLMSVNYNDIIQALIMVNS